MRALRHAVKNLVSPTSSQCGELQQNNSFLVWSSSILMEMLVAVLIPWLHMFACVGVCLVSTWWCKVQKYIIRVSVINSMHTFNSYLAGKHWSAGCPLNYEDWFVQKILWPDAFLDTNLDNCHSLWIHYLWDPGTYLASLSLCLQCFNTVGWASGRAFNM